MWCWWCVVSQPCCCGPCEMRITTGAKIVFCINLTSLVLLNIAIFFLFNDLAPLIFFTVMFCILALVNVGGLAGLRKNGSFLPVPDTWRQRMKLRDKYQYCLLMPWIIVYGLITVCWSLVIIPALAAVIFT